MLAFVADAVRQVTCRTNRTIHGGVLPKRRPRPECKCTNNTLNMRSSCASERETDDVSQAQKPTPSPHDAVSRRDVLRRMHRGQTTPASRHAALHAVRQMPQGLNAGAKVASTRRADARQATYPCHNGPPRQAVSTTPMLLGRTRRLALPSASAERKLFTATADKWVEPVPANTTSARHGTRAVRRPASRSKAAHSAG